MPKYAGTPLASDWDRLQKRRAVMDAITQQSMAPYGGTERVSGRSVPYSWGTGVGQLGKALIGKYGEQKVAEEEKELGQQYSEQRQKSMDRVIGALQGTPEQPYELSQEEQFEGEQIPGLKTAGVAPDPQRAAVMLGADPYLQESAMATQMLKNQAAAAKGASGGYPSYEPISTPQGIRVFDRRGGGFLTQDEVVRRSRDDVELQAALAGAKGYAGQMGTGQAEALTDPITKAAVTAAGQGRLGQAALTPAQLVTEKAQAEAEEERAQTAVGTNQLINEATAIFEGDQQPTASGVGTMVDWLGGQFGASPAGADEAAQLKVIGGALVGKVPRFRGAQSDKDVNLYREMAGRIGDSTVPISQRKAALEKVKSFWAQYERTGTAEPTGTTEPTVAAEPTGAAQGAFSDTEKERRYQEWKASQ
jgi:hypothetical protein